MNYQDLWDLVNGDGTEISARRELESTRAVVAPCTAYEDHHIKEGNKLLLSSKAAELNRIEKQLLKLYHEGKAPEMPIAFAGGADTQQTLSTLTVSHRAADAIIENTEFMDDYGDNMEEATVKNARPLFEVSPTSCLFGIWNQISDYSDINGFSSALVPEIFVTVGDVVSCRSAKGDALGLGETKGDKVPVREGTRKPLSHEEQEELLSEMEEDEIKKHDDVEMVKHSEIGLGKLPPSENLHIVPEKIEQKLILSLDTIQSLQLDSKSEEEYVNGGGSNNQQEKHFHTVLAALGLVSMTLLSSKHAGYNIRSRCNLRVKEGEKENEYTLYRGSKKEKIELEYEDALNLYQKALEEARKAGLDYEFTGGELFEIKDGLKDAIEEQID